jgi:hypothetical protein
MLSVEDVIDHLIEGAVVVLAHVVASGALGVVEDFVD